MSLNLKRRHLNESQRAMVASGLANMRQGARTDIASIDAMSQDAAATLLNVSRPSLQRAKQVTETGAPELVQAVQAGEVSVSAAADVATLPENRTHRDDDVREGANSTGSRRAKEPLPFAR